MSDLAEHLRQLGLAADLPFERRPFVQLQLSRVGLSGDSFREQVEQIAADYAVRIVEARLEPMPGVVPELSTAGAPHRSLGQREPEEMFLLAFRQALNLDPTEAHFRLFHRAYSEAQEP